MQGPQAPRGYQCHPSFHPMQPPLLLPLHSRWPQLLKLPGQLLLHCQQHLLQLVWHQRGRQLLLLPPLRLQAPAAARVTVIHTRTEIHTSSVSCTWAQWLWEIVRWRRSCSVGEASAEHTHSTTSRQASPAPHPPFQHTSVEPGAPPAAAAAAATAAAAAAAFSAAPGPVSPPTRCSCAAACCSCCRGRA